MPFKRNPLFSRRKLLASMGVSAAVAPFLPLLESEAGGPTTPKRFITVFTPHGTIKQNWQPTGTGSGWALSPILQPLAGYKDRLVAIDGLDIKPQPPYGGAHTVGPAYLFTGSRMEEGNEFQHQSSGGPHGWASSWSIDQAIAALLSKDSLLPSLEFGVQTGGGHPGSRISYAGPSQPLAPESDPQRMYQSLFGEQNLDIAQQQKLRQERLAVIDVIKPQLDSLQSKVSQSDKIKIEAHLDGVISTQNKVSALYDCNEPDLGPTYNANDFAAMQEIAHQQIDMLVEAMACGLTNVASLMYRRGENDALPYPFLPSLPASQEHHLTTHAPDTDAEARAQLTEIYTWYSGELAYLAQKLDAIEDPEGGTMLDNTLILWGSEIAKGNNHTWDDMSFLLLGGGSGSIITDQYLRFNGQAHNQLLTTVGRAMGLDIDTFGDLDDVQGPLPGILT